MERLLKLARWYRSTSWHRCTEWREYHGLLEADFQWAKDEMHKLDVKPKTKQIFREALDDYWNPKA